MTPAPNRRWSFSLRTLFVVVTILAVSVGWAVSEWRRGRQWVYAASVATNRSQYVVAALHAEGIEAEFGNEFSFVGSIAVQRRDLRRARELLRKLQQKGLRDISFD